MKLVAEEWEAVHSWTLGELVRGAEFMGHYCLVGARSLMGGNELFSGQSVLVNNSFWEK